MDRLVLEFIKGNSDAFDTIYYETQKSVYLSIRLIISNKDIIEDLSQLFHSPLSLPSRGSLVPLRFLP